MSLHYIDHWAGVVLMKLNAKTKKVQNVNVFHTDQTAIYSNFQAAMTTQCIWDQLPVRVRCCMSEYDYTYNSTSL